MHNISSLFNSISVELIASFMQTCFAVGETFLVIFDEKLCLIYASGVAIGAAVSF